MWFFFHIIDQIILFFNFRTHFHFQRFFSWLSNFEIVFQIVELWFQVFNLISVLISFCSFLGLKKEWIKLELLFIFISPAEPLRVFKLHQWNTWISCGKQKHSELAIYPSVEWSNWLITNYVCLGSKLIWSQQRFYTR